MILTLSGEEPPCSTAGRSVPWFLREGASLSWRLEKTTGGPVASSVLEWSVSRVKDGNITFLMRTDTAVSNLTMTNQTAWDNLSTLAASLLSIEPRIDNLSYDAQIATFDAIGVSFPAFVERASYVFDLQNRFTEERVTELTSFVLLYSNVTLESSYPDSPPFLYTEVFQLLSVSNTSSLPVQDVEALQLRVDGNSTKFSFFNTGTPSWSSCQSLLLLKVWALARLTREPLVLQEIANSHEKYQFSYANTMVKGRAGSGFNASNC